MKIIHKTTCFIAVLLLFCFSCAPVQAYSYPQTHIEAKAAVLMDMDTGKILFGQNADERLYSASLTKIMTAMLALENAELTDVVTASENAVTYGLNIHGSTINIKAGETMTLESLIYATLVASANEACNIIAEHVSGSISGFVELMNEKAAALGCKNTHFTNAHGLHDEDHYSSASDIARIAYAAMQIPEFVKMCNTKSVTIPATNMSPERTLYTTNYLISTEKVDGYFYKYASGIKTGFTTPAGHCLVSTADNGKLRLLGVIMGAGGIPQQDGTEKVQSFVEIVKLFEWGFSHFSVQEAISVTLPVAQVNVKFGANTNFVLLYPAEPFSMLLPTDFDKSLFVTKVNIYNDGIIEAPVSRGDVLGDMDIYLDGAYCGNVKLLALTDVQRSNTEAAAHGIKGFFRKPWVRTVLILIPIFLVLYIAYMIFYNAMRRRAIAAGKYRGDYRSRRRHRR